MVSNEGVERHVKLESLSAVAPLHYYDDRCLVLDG